MINRRIKKLKSSISKRLKKLNLLFNKRDDKIVLFGSWFGDKFADNSRFLFQYLAENKELLKLKHVVWVTRNAQVYKTLCAMGYEAYMMGTEESIHFHKKAGWHICCNNPISGPELNGDLNGELSLGAKRVNLWHGVGFKGINYAGNKKKNNVDSIKIKLRKYPIYMKWLQFTKVGWIDYYLLTTTDLTTKIFDLSFRLPNSRYILSAYPRNCPVVRLTEDEKMILSKLSKFQYIIMYLPTFRSGSNHFSYVDFASQLRTVLLENNAVWIQKSHSADKNNCINIGEDGNVINLDPNFDINVLLPYITLLVTDYSSVSLDAIYHNKAVLYLTPDYEEYKNGDNGFVIDPAEVMCGPKFDSIDELKNNILKYLKDPESAKFERYDEIKVKFWGDENKTLDDVWRDILRVMGKRL